MSVWSSSFLSFHVWCEINKCSLVTTNTASSSWWGDWVCLSGLSAQRQGFPLSVFALAWEDFLIHQIAKFSLKSQCEYSAYNILMTICPEEQILLLSLSSWWSWKSVEWFLGLFSSFLPSFPKPECRWLGQWAFIHLVGCSWNISHQPWWFSMSGTNTLKCQIMCKTEEVFYCSLCLTDSLCNTDKFGLEFSVLQSWQREDFI